MPSTCRKLLHSFAATGARLTDVIFPPLCPFCRIATNERSYGAHNGKTNPELIKEDGLCPQCLKSITAITSPMCVVCGEPFISASPSIANSEQAQRTNSHCAGCLKDKPLFVQTLSGFAYKDKLKGAIQHFKYNGQTMLAPMLAALIAGTASKLAAAHEITFDKIVPVPLHKNRLRERGFNQSLLLARELASLDPKLGRSKIDYLSLQRIRDTKSQTELKGKERTTNVKGAFAIKDTNIFKDKKVLLIDDVYTTGATIRECSKVLCKGGAEVFALTLARVTLV